MRADSHWLVILVLTAWIHVVDSTASAQESLVYGDLIFSGGKAAFADALELFDPLFSGGPKPDNSNAENALGPANGFYGALGRGGAIQVRFADNLLINSGDEKPDLFFAESMGTPESAFMFLRPTPESAELLPSAADPDQDGFFSIGEQVASKNLSPGRLASIYGLVDLDSLFPGFEAGKLRFDGIRIIDNPDSGATTGGTVGMDLESIGTLSMVAVETIRGDFNFDGRLDDLDLAYMKTQGLAWLFDLTGDGLNTVEDRDYWVREIMQSGPGDANFDGQFNSDDLLQVFAAGEYEDLIAANSRWSTGDWNYSGDFNSRDLVAAAQSGHYDQGPIVKPAAVPESSSGAIALVLFACSRIRRRACPRREAQNSRPVRA